MRELEACLAAAAVRLAGRVQDVVLLGCSADWKFDARTRIH